MAEQIKSTEMSKVRRVVAIAGLGLIGVAGGSALFASAEGSTCDPNMDDCTITTDYAGNETGGTFPDKTVLETTTTAPTTTVLETTTTAPTTTVLETTTTSTTVPVAIVTTTTGVPVETVPVPVTVPVIPTIPAVTK